MAFFANMGKKLADKAIKKTTKNMAPKAAAIVSSIITAITTIITMLPIILIVSAIVVVVTALDWIIETITAKANSEELYSVFELKEKEDDMTKMIQIKKNDDGEYYLDFVDDVDEKIEKYIEKSNNQAGYHNMPEDVEFFKKIIQAEVCMKFPNLGGKVPEDSSGFQGVVDVRRVTPDKEIGEMKNTGQGEKKKVEEDEIGDPVEVSQYEEIVKTWEANEKFELINDAIVYKERESEIKKGEGTGVFDVQYKEGTEIKLSISKGNTITYTGKYKAVTNPLTKKISVYVEIRYTDIQGYIKAYNLIRINNEEGESDIDTNESEGDTTRVASNDRITSRTKEKTIGKADKTYTVAIAAGHNNTDNTGATGKYGLIEQDLTVKVAEKVEEILKDYSNIKVVQTGSTSSNRGGVKLADRRQLARDANPDLCIQIHFNAGGGTGSEVIYKKGDGISQELAEVLSKTISESMGIRNRGDGCDIDKCGGRSLGIIENSATSGFPSVVTEGAFLDGDPDSDIIKNQNGIQKYAQGIIEGIDKYFQSDHKGYSSINKNDENVTESIKSVVKNLKYLPPEEFDGLVSSGSKEALNYFTLDEDNKLITATWGFSGGTISIEKNPPVDLTTTLQQYIVPFEYLLFFYIDANYQDFSEDLADKILKSEVVIAVKDNVTTKKEVVTTQTKTDASDSSYSTDWSNSGTTTTITEEVSTAVDVTYVDTWCVTTYNENSYSDKSLGMGKKDKVTSSIDGTVTERDTSSLSSQQVTGSGTAPTGEKDEDDNDITYSYTNYQRDQTNTSEISNDYESGETKTEGKESTFVKLYQKHEMHKKVRTDGYLFSIIENNEKTANLLNLTKYLIFKATGVDDGVVEYDFDEFGIPSSNYATIGEGGGYSFTENDTIVWKNNYTKENFVKYIKNLKVPNPNGCASGSGLATNQQGWNTFYKGCAEQWFDICTKNGIDPIVIMSWSLHESGYGTSRYAQERGNLWGWGAYNSNPDHALSGSGNSKAIKAMNLLEEICKSLNKTIKDPNYNSRRSIAISKGLKNPDLTTIKGTGYWYCVPPGHWIESTVKMLKDRFGDFVSQYCSQSGDSSQIGTVTLTGDKAEKMKKLLNEAVRIANDDRYLYSQAKRYEEFYYDCSSLVFRLYKKYFGITVPTTTSGYGTQYRVGRDGEVKLQPGDVLWTDTPYGHVEIYIGNGKRVGAHTDNCPAKDQISIKDYQKGYYKYVYRFIN